jgi:hypothetical protein
MTAVLKRSARSSALQEVFGQVGSFGMKSLFTPVEKPAPPWPCSPDFNNIDPA